MMFSLNNCAFPATDCSFWYVLASMRKETGFLWEMQGTDVFQIIFQESVTNTGLEMQMDPLHLLTLLLLFTEILFHVST